MTIHRFLKKLTPRNMTAFVLANLAMGVTYFISAPNDPTSSAYSILEPVLTQNAEATTQCNKRCVPGVPSSCYDYMGWWCDPGASCSEGVISGGCP